VATEAAVKDIPGIVKEGGMGIRKEARIGGSGIT
jgi:hypothetical protein